jgi:hypothetical protein
MVVFLRCPTLSLNFLSVTVRLVNHDESEGAWQLEKIEEVTSEAQTSPITAIQH